MCCIVSYLIQPIVPDLHFASQSIVHGECVWRHAQSIAPRDKLQFYITGAAVAASDQ